jgi:hypothetical protein
MIEPESASIHAPPQVGVPGLGEQSGRQLLSFARVHPEGQQPSLSAQAEMVMDTHWAWHVPAFCNS